MIPRDIYHTFITIYTTVRWISNRFPGWYLGLRNHIFNQSSLKSIKHREKKQPSTPRRNQSNQRRIVSKVNSIFPGRHEALVSLQPRQWPRPGKVINSSESRVSNELRLVACSWSIRSRAKWTSTFGLYASPPSFLFTRVCACGVPGWRCWFTRRVNGCRSDAEFRCNEAFVIFGMFTRWTFESYK